MAHWPREQHAVRQQVTYTWFQPAGGLRPNEWGQRMGKFLVLHHVEVLDIGCGIFGGTCPNKPLIHKWQCLHNVIAAHAPHMILFCGPSTYSTNGSACITTFLFF